MKERMFLITCPHCGHSFEIKRDTMLLHGMNATIEKRLDEGTYFTHQCQNCKRLFYMMHPFLYRDPDRKYVLILSNQEHFNNLPENEQVVVCNRVSDFLLAYKIYSQRANARIVIGLKKRLEQKYGCEIWFDSYDAGQDLYWFLVRQELVAVYGNNGSFVS